MACKTCGGGRSLSPNLPISPKVFIQSPTRIVTTPHSTRSGGYQNNTEPNKPIVTKRTTV